MQAGELGEAITAAMQRKGLKGQRAVARELQVSQQTLSKWVLGVHFPGDEYLPILAAFLDTTPEAVEAMRPSTARETRRANTARIAALEEQIVASTVRQAAILERLETLAGQVERLDKALRARGDEL